MTSLNDMARQSMRHQTAWQIVPSVGKVSSASMSTVDGMSATGLSTTLQPESSITDQYLLNSTIPTLSPASHIVVGCYLLFVGTMGVVGNILFIGTVVRHRRELTIHEMFLINLAVADTGVCLTGYPWSAASSFAQRWLFGHEGCQWYGFCGFFFGVASINTLVVISVDRFSTISCRNPSFQIRTAVRAGVLIAMTWAVALFWAVMPLVGWSHYAPEPFQTACSVNWHGKDIEDISLIISMFVCVVGVNIIVITISYGGIVHTIRHQQRVFPTPNTSSRITGRAEKRTTLVSFAVVLGFLVCWMPYSVFSLWYSFFSDTDIPVEATVVPALMAKSSSYINPIIYVIAVKKYRRLVLAYVCRRKTSVNQGLKIATPQVGLTLAEGGLTPVSDKTLYPAGRAERHRPGLRTISSISSSRKNPLPSVEMNTNFEASVSDPRNHSRGLTKVYVAPSKIHNAIVQEESEISEYNVNDLFSQHV